MVNNLDNDIDLHLSTGQKFSGKSIGAPVVSSGELVFTTGMVGYTEALTDPSYFGQILTFTYPLIGNYGVPEKSEYEKNNTIPLGLESQKIWASGVLINESFDNADHHNSKINFSAWLKKNNIPGISYLDTRLLTQIIRQSETVFAKIIPRMNLGLLNRPSFQFLESSETHNNYFKPSDHILYDEVSNDSVQEFGSGQYLINVINFGIKWNIIREILKNNARVRLLPWNCAFENYLDADGWILSNGPGDPARDQNLIRKIKNLTDQNIPLFGICLGHQLLALALGAQTQKLRFGHRSHNQPVIMRSTQKAYVTSQNHGYVVEKLSLPDHLEIWFENINDGSIEGLKHKTKLIRSVQFHPEASGGPQDTSFLIRDFLTDISKRGFSIADSSFFKI